MSRILGLDVSTSTVGWCILENSDGSFVSAGAIELKKKSIFEKSEIVRNELRELSNTHSITRVAIEENLQAFRPGFSSAKTIVTLARFNGIVTLLAFEETNVQPDFMNVNAARKAVGLKIDRKSDASTKEQVFSFVKSEIPDYDWPTRTMKSGPRKGLVLFADSCYDISDAYVVASSCVKNER